MNRISAICGLVLAFLLRPDSGGATNQSVENLYLAKQYVARGQQYMNMNLWDEAEQEFWKAVALDFNNISARQGLGDMFRRKEKFEEAIENYQSVLNQQPNNVDIQYLISLSYYDNHQYELARLAAEKALQMNPELAKAENLVRLSQAKQLEQQQEINLLRQKEEAALKTYRQVQERKEQAFIGTLVPGWRLIQTAESKPMWKGYVIFGGTVGLMLGGHFMRSSGQKAYTQASTSVTRDFYRNQVDLGQSRYKYGGYMIDGALGLFALNILDSIIFKGKIFGGRTRVKPSLPERDHHKPY